MLRRIVAIGAYTDKEHPPDVAGLEAALGAGAGLWREAVALLEDRLGAKPELRFYGSSYGWAMRYRRKGKALASLYPGESSFTAQIVLPQSAEDRVRDRLRPGTRARLDAANSYREGRWLFLPIGCDDDLAELELLLTAKLAPA